MLDDELIIKINKNSGVIKIFNEYTNIWFEYDLDKFQITSENPESDNEDFNDNARWITKTLLEIIKLEEKDTNAHCDWSADYEQDKETGKYLFITRIIKAEQKDL